LETTEKNLDQLNTKAHQNDKKIDDLSTKILILEAGEPKISSTSISNGSDTSTKSDTKSDTSTS
jgi:hypothetical protein